MRAIALFLRPYPSLVRLHEMRTFVDGRVRPHQGAGRGKGPCWTPVGSQLTGQHHLSPPPPAPPPPGPAPEEMPTVHTWEGRQFILITWDTPGPPTDATTLLESQGGCGEYFITRVCFPQGVTPFDLIFNFYILIKSRSNGGGLSGETYF